MNLFGHNLQLTFVTSAVYTKGMLGVKFFKIVHCSIRNSVMAVLLSFLVDSCLLIVAVVQK